MGLPRAAAVSAVVCAAATTAAFLSLCPGAAAAAADDDDTPCVCVPEVKEGHPYSTWIGWYFRDCVYTVTERWAFSLGLSTIGIWMVAQLPQMFKSHRLKRVEGVSSGLLLQWLCGDITNLLGCVLADQLKTQLFTALYFCTSDIFLVSQYSYYRFFYTGPRVSTRTTSAIPEEEWVHVRRRSWPSAAAAAAKSERQPLLSPASDSYVTPATAAGTATHSDMSWSHSAIFPVGSSAGPDSGQPGAAHPDPAPTAARWAIVVAVGALLGAIFGLLAWDYSQDNPDGGGGGSGAPVVCNATKTLNSRQELIGTLSAWGSGLLYFLSRIPQLVQNYRRKSMYGLSILMFVLSITANLTYGASILLRFPAVDDKFWTNTFPYLVGSIGTLLFDVGIMVQACIYGTDPPMFEGV